MPVRLGLTNDVDLAPLCFPWEAGWVNPPAGTTVRFTNPGELERALLAGELDVAPVGPLTYLNNQTTLRLLPVPVRAAEMASDSVFLFSLKRLDQLDKVRVAFAPGSSTGEALLMMIAPNYYGITPEPWPVASEAAALETLNGTSQMCVVSGEAAMRAAGWAKAKGLFVEDLTKAWWILTGTPLPICLFAVREEWTRQEPNASAIARELMVAFRRAIQYSQDQRPTLLAKAEERTGLPAEALDNHFRAQRYELNEAHLRGLLEFYRRAAAANLGPALADLTFFPALTPVAPAPAAPPRRSQPEVPKNDRAGNNKRSNGKTNSRRSEAEAKGLRIIKGGRDESDNTENDDNDEE